MSGRVNAVLEVLRRVLVEPIGRLGLALGACGMYRRPPFATATGSEVLVRANELNGTVNAYTAGTVLVLPGIHQVRRYSIRDQVYRLTEGASATGPAPFQSTEGLSIGVDLTVRWAIDRHRVAQMSKDFPDDLNADLVGPAVSAIAYPLFARYTVRDIFSGRRAEIQRELTSQLAPKLAAMGLQLRSVSMGQVDLPPDYRSGMEKLLAEELETEKVRYTLQLKEAQVKQTQLESEADKVARIRTAEGAAAARRIEAEGEAASRQMLADAEAYRLDLVGKANAGQMEREGILITHYPLLIQKTLADKLSDKVQVIIAPTPGASAEQRALAALGLTRPDCIDPALSPTLRTDLDQQRSAILEGIAERDLTPLTRSRLHARRAAVWASLAFEQARHSEPSERAGQRALAELLDVQVTDLGEDRRPEYVDAAARVSASRWAAAVSAKSSARLTLSATPADPGQTCVTLQNVQPGAAPLVQRCTYGIAWPASAQVIAQGQAVVLAVQPLETWRELWIFHRRGGAWVVDVLPPGIDDPDEGYIEYAGYVPGTGCLLIAREVKVRGHFRHSFEELRLDDLVTVRQASSPELLRDFGHWQDVNWRRDTLSLH